MPEDELSELLIPFPTWEEYKPKIITSSVTKITYVPIPKDLQEPTMDYSVSTWEKIWCVINTYKSYIDVLIKLSPIIIPLLQVCRWAVKVKEEKRNV